MKKDLNYQETKEYKKRVNNVKADFNKLETYFKKVIKNEKETNQLLNQILQQGTKRYEKANDLTKTF